MYENEEASENNAVQPSNSLGKVLLAIGSFVVCVLVYGAFMGTAVATWFMLLLFAHEMGHVIAARYRRIPATLPLFIPFVGAVISLKGEVEDPNDEAIVGIGGPLLGTVACLVTFGLAIQLRSADMLHAATLGTFLNLLNLIPVRPFDGGRIAQAIGGWTQWLALPVAGLALWYIPFNPIVKVLLIVSIVSEFGGRKRELPWRNTLAWGAAYLILAGGLILLFGGMVHFDLAR